VFETLQMAPPDAILGLTEAFRADPNPAKINLSVGVYKDANGATPVLKSVKAAEQKLLETEDTKGYLGIDGSPEYGAVVRSLLFGENHPILTGNRARTIQAPGGTGALRVAGELIAASYPRAKMWCSKPTWANHANIFSAAGLPVEFYPYINSTGDGLDFEALLAALKQIPAGDAICLHGCCHNPTGIDPTPAQWQEIAAVVKDRGLLPLVDFAYQGFGEGIEADAAGLHAIASAVDELLVCSSFSKNFGLYSERVGAFTMVAAGSDTADAVLSHAKRCVRANYSNPPRHGAAIVTTVLSDAELNQQWLGELADMRNRINGMRELFATTMKEQAPQHDFSFITRQRGMFSFSGLNPMQVDELKNTHAIYIVGSGRINVAGMNASNMPALCKAIAAVL